MKIISDLKKYNYGFDKLSEKKQKCLENILKNSESEDRNFLIEYLVSLIRYNDDIKKNKSNLVKTLYESEKNQLRERLDYYLSSINLLSDIQKILKDSSNKNVIVSIGSYLTDNDKNDKIQIGQQLPKFASYLPGNTQILNIDPNFSFDTTFSSNAAKVNKDITIKFYKYILHNNQTLNPNKDIANLIKKSKKDNDKDFQVLIDFESNVINNINFFNITKKCNNKIIDSLNNLIKKGKKLIIIDSTNSYGNLAKITTSFAFANKSAMYKNNLHIMSGCIDAVRIYGAINIDKIFNRETMLANLNKSIYSDKIKKFDEFKLPKNIEEVLEDSRYYKIIKKYSDDIKSLEKKYEKKPKIFKKYKFIIELSKEIKARTSKIEESIKSQYKNIKPLKIFNNLNEIKLTDLLSVKNKKKCKF